jgi:hypothetical protein
MDSLVTKPRELLWFLVLVRSFIYFSMNRNRELETLVY